jgi:hypothetical protein
MAVNTLWSNERLHLTAARAFRSAIWEDLRILCHAQPVVPAAVGERDVRRLCIHLGRILTI